MKIIDFGIAKELDRPRGPGAAMSMGPEPLTRAGAFIGSPRYMSPEQAQSKEVDARGDQYALGCILYQMLTGTPPFEAEADIDLLWMHITQPVPPPRQRRPGLAISAALEAVILRTLSKQREERFPSMEALALALEQQLQPRGGRALFARRRGLALGLALVGLTATSLLGWRIYRMVSAPPQLRADDLERYRQQAVTALLAVAQRPEGAPELAASALKALGQSRQPALAPQLEGALKRPDPVVQRGAAEGLGQLGEASALAPLRARLAEPGPPGLLVAVALALDNLGEPSGLMFLERALRSPEPRLLRAAALALCSRRSAAVRAQAAALESRPLDASDDLPLLTCLARAGETAARERLQSLLAAAPRDEDRFVIAARLAELGEASGQQFLRGLLHKPGPQQFAAARLLAAPAEPDTAALFRRTLDEGRVNPSARLLAAEGLGLSGQLEDLRRLQPLLAPSIDAESRVAAAQSMLQIIQNDPVVAAQQSLQWVRSALSDTRPAVRETAVELLAQDTTHDVVPVLVELTHDESPAVRQRAVAALGQRATPAALAALKRGLGDSDAAVRAEAIRALPKVARAAPASAQPELREALQQVLSRGTEVDKALARSQLLKLGDAGQLSQLSALRAAAAVDVRRAVVRENSMLPDLLRGFLKDADWQVRWTAARELADFGDKEAAAVLKEAIERAGPEAMAAYQRLVRLKVAVPSPPSLSRWLDSDDAGRRIEAIEATAGLPVELAVPLLSRAVHDPEPLVRLMMVTVIGGQVDAADGRRPEPELRTLLRTLMLDGNNAVRLRAQAIYARLAQRPEGPPPAAGSRAPKLAPLDKELVSAAKEHPPLAEADADPPAPAGKPGAAEKMPARAVALTVAAPVAVWFRVDRRPWVLAARSTLALYPGPHSITTIDKTQSVDLREPQEVKLQESALEQLVKTGLRSLGSGDLRSGQRSLERVQAMCARDRSIDPPCGALSYDLSFRLASVYEEQGRWTDAMKELQRLSELAKTGRIKARPEQQAAVLAATGRLGGRLGQVVLIGGKKGKKGACEEKMLWLPPGTHSINHAGKVFMVQVRAKETVRAGSCP